MNNKEKDRSKECQQQNKNKMKKNFLIFYLNIIQKIKVIISLIKEFLAIPTTPDYILNLLKINRNKLNYYLYIL